MSFDTDSLIELPFCVFCGEPVPECFLVLETDDGELPICSYEHANDLFKSIHKRDPDWTQIET